VSPIITKWKLALSEPDSALEMSRSLPAGWLLGLLVVLLVSLGLLGDPVRLALRYERTAILAGEYWRLLSGHFIHGSNQHLILNLAGLGLIAALFPRGYTAKGWLLVLLLSVLIIDVGFVFYEPQLQWYVGFSGVLHGALAAGAIAWWRSDSALFAAALSVILIGKLIWEQWHGALPLSGDLPVVVDAHLYGALGGAAAASILWAARQHWFCRPRSL
jgi:rhomboid family GlyGly-CTERM serine protease